MSAVSNGHILMSVFLLCVSHTGQHPSEEGTLAGHHQGGADPGGLQPAEHPLQEAVGGPAALGLEDLRGLAGEGLPTRKGCPSNPDPPNVPHSGSGITDLDGRLKAAQQPQGVAVLTVVVGHGHGGILQGAGLALFATLSPCMLRCVVCAYGECFLLFG
ncbi:hypothetical protein NDU88_004935 [Pleurodeles waltl]|uniref:Uncharacterized protein n=1 Tax=Pleurodeles waltl TaxID=8319 RepID=A0AAV7M7R7_PLEWA|nr:hypothetical protein NDU88_004935 [Pleurodeles waltl]